MTGKHLISDQEHAGRPDCSVATTRGGVRAQLAATAASTSAAGPYGYTISLGGSTALGSGQLGAPGLASALLLMAGAVAGFAMLERAAGAAALPPVTGLGRRRPDRENAHVLAIGAALSLVWCTLHVATGLLAWAAVGFVATTVTFGGTLLQRALVRRIAASRGKTTSVTPSPANSEQE